MKNVMQLAVIGALAAGMAFAQAPSPSGNPPAGAHGTARNMLRQHMDNIAQKLNLTEAQRKEFHTIFQPNDSYIRRGKGEVLPNLDPGATHQIRPNAARLPPADAGSLEPAR